MPRHAAKSVNTKVNTRRAEVSRKDKGDPGRKFDPTKGADYQVRVADADAPRDAIKEDRE